MSKRLIKKIPAVDPLWRLIAYALIVIIVSLVIAITMVLYCVAAAGLIAAKRAKRLGYKLRAKFA